MYKDLYTRIKPQATIQVEVYEKLSLTVVEDICLVKVIFLGPISTRLPERPSNKNVLQQRSTSSCLDYMSAGTLQHSQSKVNNPW